MEKPESLKNSIILMWMILALSTAIVLIEKLSGNFTMGIFVIEIIVMSLYAIFPIKINNGSDTARYIYVILNIASIIFNIGAMQEIENLKSNANNYTIMSMILGAISGIMTIYTFYGIFTKESNEYFRYIKDKKEQ